MHTRWLAVAAFAVAFGPDVASAQASKVKDIAVAPHWIYDDVPAAFARAKETGKPILALFR
jgi:hypothetical protein